MGVGARVAGTFPSSSGRECAAAAGDGITLEGLEKAVAAVLSEEVRASAGRYGDVLREEDGVRMACSAIASGTIAFQK